MAPVVGLWNNLGGLSRVQHRVGWNTWGVAVGPISSGPRKKNEWNQSTIPQRLNRKVSGGNFSRRWLWWLNFPNGKKMGCQRNTCNLCSLNPRMSRNRYTIPETHISSHLKNGWARNTFSFPFGILPMFRGLLKCSFHGRENLTRCEDKQYGCLDFLALEIAVNHRMQHFGTEAPK